MTELKYSEVSLSDVPQLQRRGQGQNSRAPVFLPKGSMVGGGRSLLRYSSEDLFENFPFWMNNLRLREMEVLVFWR